MAIMTDSRGNIFLEFINIEYDKVIPITLDAPLTCSNRGEVPRKVPFHAE
ncbi:hypothetical protein [Paenibacillus pabuli]|nr:hypothetical protein [Paenibacillus pabuli]UPK42675.1 hypothetical protein KET34_26405 [Paenibacillus pabuli]